jgi:ABC-type nickel/cobalt efflux system permease component RcnA
VEFREAAHHHHHDEDTGSAEFQDAYERAHALDIAKRFAGRNVTTPQIILFGVTGGLMPCPAAFTVLLVCLQLKRVTLGFAMVGAFSFGLALTMVATGVIAAWSVRHAEKRFRGFGEMMRRAPYVSCILLVTLATYMAWHGRKDFTIHEIQKAHDKEINLKQYLFPTFSIIFPPALHLVPYLTAVDSDKLIKTPRGRLARR